MPRAVGTGCTGKGVVGCGGTPAVHLPPQREKGSSGDFPNRLWAGLNHGGLTGFGGHILESDCCHFLPLLRKVERLGCFSHHFLQSWHRALTSKWAPGRNPPGLPTSSGPSHAHLLLLASAQLSGPEHKARKSQSRAQPGSYLQGVVTGAHVAARFSSLGLLLLISQVK